MWYMSVICEIPHCEAWSGAGLAGHLTWGTGALCNPTWKVVEAAEFAFSFEPPTFFQSYTSLPEEHLYSLSPPKATHRRLIKASIYLTNATR